MPKSLLKTAPRPSTSTTTAYETGRHATTLTDSRHQRAQAHRAARHRPRRAALLAHMLSIHIAIAVDLATRHRQSCPPLELPTVEDRERASTASPATAEQHRQRSTAPFGVSHSYPFHVSIRQSVAQVLPTHRQHDDLMGEPEPGETRPRCWNRTTAHRPTCPSP